MPDRPSADRPDAPPAAYYRRAESGPGTYHDWDTGAAIDGYVGEYLYLEASDPCVLRTWIDAETGERAHRYVRAWRRR